MTEKDYALRIVGGRFDGIAGMYWSDDGEHPPPDRIVVGTCTGDGECSTGTRAACRQYALLMRRANGEQRAPSKLRHPAYWSVDEDFRPVDAERYRLTHVTGDGDKSQVWEAVYVLAGVSRRDPASVSEESPLTVADILAAKPPQPATVAGMAEAARRMGLRVTSGAAARAPMCQCSLHLTYVDRPWTERLWEWLSDGRHDKGWA